MTPDRGFVPGDTWLLRQVTDPRLAPGGRHVAFVVATPDRETDTSESVIWVTPTEGSAPARRFTAGPKDSAPRWSPPPTTTHSKAKPRSASSPRAARRSA